MYDGARALPPQDSANGLLQPGASTSQLKTDEEEPEAEPVLVKKAHREILDHERKRRVELKCMELQEMMEEQGYSEEEIRQKVGTFRQMLMEKEGVITREGPHRCPVVNHCCEGQREEQADAEDYAAECDCYGDSYDRESVCYSDYRTKRKSSSSPSPPPKKRKKKRSGRRRSRFDSTSPSRKEKKKKSGKKHKRDRSASGTRKKRRYKSGSQKNKHKEKSKQRKRSPADSPSRRSHRRGSCSSRSASFSSAGSLSKSPSRLSLKDRVDEDKPGPSLSNCGPSPSPADPPLWQNGHRDGSRNGRDGREKFQDALRSSRGSPNPKRAKAQDPNGSYAARLSVPPGSTVTGDDYGQGAVVPSPAPSKHSSHQRAPGRSSHSPTHSSDSAHSPHNPPVNKSSKGSQQRKARGSRTSKRRHRNRTQARHRSSSASPSRRSRRASGRKKSSSHSLRQCSSSWSSEQSGSRSRSREHGSKAKSPPSRRNQSREKDSAHHTDSESRARRRSRSYSPIRKRRRDSPSFMEARRITSARKRPIPYYRPSPSSSSSLSSHSVSSCTYESYSSYSRGGSRSRSRSISQSRSRSVSRSISRSRSRSVSRNDSYYSRSSSESPGF